MRERLTWATTLSEHEAGLGDVRDRILEAAALRAGQTVLDLGAGTGLLTFGAFARVSPGGRLIAVDRDPGCLDTVSRRAASIGALGQDILVAAGSADAIPLVSSAVDAVIIRSVLVYVADRPTAAAELGRVLKPGGRASIFEPLPGRLREEGPATWQPCWAVRVALERLIAEQREAPRNRAVAELTAGGLATTFREAGLADVETTLGLSLMSPPADPARHFDILRLPGDPSPEHPPWYTLLRQRFSEADIRAYVDHAVAEARRGHYRVVLPTVYLSAKRS